MHPNKICKSAVIVLSIILTAFALSGCATKTNSQDAVVQSIFECSFSADYQKMKISGHIKTAENSATIILNEPKTLSGAKFTVYYDNEKIKAEVGGISFDFDDNKYINSAFVRLFIKSLQQCFNDALQSDNSYESLRFNADTNTFVGKLDNHEFELTINENALPTKLVCKDYDLLVDFLYE